VTSSTHKLAVKVGVATAFLGLAAAPLSPATATTPPAVATAAPAPVTINLLGVAVATSVAGPLARAEHRNPALLTHPWVILSLRQTLWQHS